MLGGHPGEQLEVRGPGGVPLSTVTLRRAQQGRDVQLTIDRSIQQKVQSVLDATVSRTGAHSATALVLDPRNGSILAMATAPGYDNNERSRPDPPSSSRATPTTWRSSTPTSPARPSRW